MFFVGFGFLGFVLLDGGDGFDVDYGGSGDGGFVYVIGVGWCGGCGGCSSGGRCVGIVGEFMYGGFDGVVGVVMVEVDYGVDDLFVVGLGYLF